MDALSLLLAVAEEVAKNVYFSYSWPRVLGGDHEPLKLRRLMLVRVYWIQVCCCYCCPIPKLNLKAAKVRRKLNLAAQACSPCHLRV